MAMRNLLGLVFLSTFCSVQAQAFINVEEVRRTAAPGFVGKSSLKLSGQRGNSDKFTSEISDLDIYRHGEDEYLVLGDYAFSDTLGTTDTNNGRLHLRYTSQPENRLSWEYFAQTEFDQFRQLKTRDLGGVNLRQRLSRDAKESFYAGYGTFFEYQLWNDNHVGRVERLNFYLSYVNVWTERASVFTTVYYQPSTVRLNDFRAQIQSGLKVGLTSRLDLDVQLASVTETRGAPGVKPTDVTFSTGFSLKH